jgi:pimeloyl-ACP methyl ester carboxylesterase
VDRVALPDGRWAQFWSGGADTGPTVLVCHGTPDTRWVARTGEAAARATGLRLLCVNRPGYGASTPADSTMLSVADDAVAVLDAWGLSRVAVLGMSVGGAYAAALGSRHPSRVTALGVVAAPAMTSSATGPLPEAVERARPELAAWAAALALDDPDDAVAERWLAALPPADAALLSTTFEAEDIAACAREALVCHDGYLRDAALLFRDWGFDPAEVRAPTQLWYGAHDDRNPPATGQWWADRIAGARLQVTPTTHLATLLANWESILSTLRRGFETGAERPPQPPARP